MPRGTKHAYRQARGTRDHITILACFNAAGEDVPPFVIYKGGSFSFACHHTFHILQPLDASFFGALKADFSGLTGDLSAVSHSFLVSKSRLMLPTPSNLPYSQLPHPRAHLIQQRWCRVILPLPPSPEPNTQNPPPPPPTNPYLTHPLVASGQVTADLAHLLAKINFTSNTRKNRRNTTKARILTAQEMSDAIEEEYHHAARREAQALAKRNTEQQWAKDTSPAATSLRMSFWGFPLPVP